MFDYANIDSIFPKRGLCMEKIQGRQTKGNGDGKKERVRELKDITSAAVICPRSIDFLLWMFSDELIQLRL